MKTSLRDRVRKRARGFCERCGVKPARNPGAKSRGTIHHIHPRRLGGIDAIENLVLLCIPCHRYVHQNEHEVAAHGFLAWVESSFLPVLHALHGWVLLVPDGTLEPLDEGEARRLVEFVNGWPQAG